MPYFDEDFLAFLNELSLNNSKDWFDKHRTRYTISVKQAFSKFVQTMIEQLQAYEPDLILEPKDCILRINRDTRFSKDKTPYNTHVTAFISKGGKKDKSQPGLFLRLSADELGIMTGCFQPDKKQLQNIRMAIASDVPAFQSIITAQKFKKLFVELKGASHKRIPADFKEIIKQEPLIARKQFYATAMLNSQNLLKENLVKTLMNYYHAASPLNHFLKQAINS